MSNTRIYAARGVRAVSRRRSRSRIRLRAAPGHRAETRPRVRVTPRTRPRHSHSRRARSAGGNGSAPPPTMSYQQRNAAKNSKRQARRSERRREEDALLEMDRPDRASDKRPVTQAVSTHPSSTFPIAPPEERTETQQRLTIARWYLEHPSMVGHQLVRDPNRVSVGAHGPRNSESAFSYFKDKIMEKLVDPLLSISQKAKAVRDRHLFGSKGLPERTDHTDPTLWSNLGTARHIFGMNQYSLVHELVNNRHLTCEHFTGLIRVMIHIGLLPNGKLRKVRADTLCRDVKEELAKREILARARARNDPNWNYHDEIAAYVHGDRRTYWNSREEYGGEAATLLDWDRYHVRAYHEDDWNDDRLSDAAMAERTRQIDIARRVYLPPPGSITTPSDAEDDDYWADPRTKSRVECNPSECSFCKKISSDKFRWSSETHGFYEKSPEQLAREIDCPKARTKRPD